MALKEGEKLGWPEGRLARSARAVSRTTALPRSCTTLAVNLTGVLGLVGALAVLRQSRPDDLWVSTLLSLAGATLPVLLLELLLRRPYQRASAAIDLSKKRVVSIERVGVKLLGLFGTLFVVGLCYWLVPEYRGDFYKPFWDLLRHGAVVFASLAVPYFVWTDGHMERPRDGYWHAGMLLLGKVTEVDRAVIKQYALGWLVKAFFLPLMFVYTAQFVDGFISADRALPAMHFVGFFEFTFGLLMGIEVTIACAGYFLTIRLWDSHIRSTEPTLLGWTVTLICYQPIWSVTYGNYFAYDQGVTWGPLLTNYPVLQMAWGSLILILIAIYSLSTVTFGVRFSNLTNRGILTNGPYRWLKHPAYVSKNLSWWLISVPFLSGATPIESVRLCLLLLFVNAIYFARAKTEERHLSNDTTYVAYAMAMNQKGLFRRLGEFWPFLQYRPPTNNKAAVQLA